MRLKEIKNNNVLIAIIIPANYRKTGVHFLTGNESALQIALIQNPKKSKVPKHIHPNYERIINETMEFMYIKKGRLLIEFYDINKNFIENQIVGEGEAVLFMSGGHAIQYIEDSEILEIRQGPYNREFDKVFF